MDIAKHNEKAWDKQVADGGRWSTPVTSEQIADARKGKWEIVLTPETPVPRDWFGELQGSKVLCLAGGGGQQGPILAAAGAEVTVFDNSPGQLQQDQMVAERDGLQIRTIQGDMRILEGLADQEFDLIFHPCSNGFIPDVNPVWQEAFRVLRPGGRLLSGFVNPLFYLFDFWEMEKGNLVVKYSVPYSDQEQLDEQKVQELIDNGEPLEFGHTLEDQIGGQLRAGFHIVALFEDDYSGGGEALSKLIKPMLATLAIRPE